MLRWTYCKDYQSSHFYSFHLVALDGEEGHGRGQPMAGTNLDAAYWARNVREQVRFRAAIERLVDAINAFLDLKCVLMPA